MRRQVNMHNYPTWFKIAMDYLPIQASAVPCEWVFSSSAQTDTRHCNQIKPELMEAFVMNRNIPFLLYYFLHFLPILLALCVLFYPFR